jgi:hypothetical protein
MAAPIDFAVRNCRTDGGVRSCAWSLDFEKHYDYYGGPDLDNPTSHQIGDYSLHSEASLDQWIDWRKWSALMEAVKWNYEKAREQLEGRVCGVQSQCQMMTNPAFDYFPAFQIGGLTPVTATGKDQTTSVGYTRSFDGSLLSVNTTITTLEPATSEDNNARGRGYLVIDNGDPTRFRQFPCWVLVDVLVPAVRNATYIYEDYRNPANSYTRTDPPQTGFFMSANVYLRIGTTYEGTPDNNYGIKGEPTLFEKMPNEAAVSYDIDFGVLPTQRGTSTEHCEGKVSWAGPGPRWNSYKKE